MFLARARSLVEKQILNEFQVVRETGQGWKCNLLPFGFVSPVQERLGRAPEASHGAETFLGFREKIDRETPAHRDPRLILANYAADETAAVLRWLASRKRFTPASCFWLNLVERRFAEIARQRLGVGPSTGPSNAIAPSPGGARGFDLTRIG